jgi:mRNA interferase MazF
LQALRFPYTISINASAKNGLADNSIALILQLRAIDKKRLNNKIGILEKSILNQIDQKLKELLAL